MRHYSAYVREVNRRQERRAQLRDVAHQWLECVLNWIGM